MSNPRARLLSPGQVRLALQLRAMGVTGPAEVARQLGVPLDRLRRSFRLDADRSPTGSVSDPVACLQRIGQVPIRNIDAADDDDA